MSSTKSLMPRQTEELNAEEERCIFCHIERSMIVRPCKCHRCKCLFCHACMQTWKSVKQEDANCPQCRLVWEEGDPNQFSFDPDRFVLVLCHACDTLFFLSLALPFVSNGLNWMYNRSLAIVFIAMLFGISSSTSTGLCLGLISFFLSMTCTYVYMCYTSSCAYLIHVAVSWSYSLLAFICIRIVIVPGMLLCKQNNTYIPLPRNVILL